MEPMDMLDEINEFAALKAQIAELQAKADAMQHRVQQRAALAVRALMAEHGLTEDQIMTPGGKLRSTHKSPSKNQGYPNKTMPVRYADQLGNTWSGMGRAPAWIANAPDREAFRIA